MDGSDKAAPRSRVMNEAEERYMRHGREPAPASVLISTSKYLNNPYYRDAWCQTSLRRVGRDVADTYLMPNMTRAIAEVTDMAEYQRLLDAEKVKNPEFGDWLAERRCNVYRADELAKYAAGTLGEAIRSFILKSGMEMEFLYKDAVETDVMYISKRQMGVHDICHIVTGFGPNMVGELALQYVHIGAIARYFTPELAQLINQTNIFSGLSTFSRISLHYHALVPTLLEGIGMGIAAGQALKRPLMMVDWDQYLDWTLDDVAADLGFVRGPGSAWDWTTEAARD